MATLTEVINDVHILTNRPDLVAEARVAIRKAIMKLHAADTFKRDLAVTRLQMATQTPVGTDQFRWSVTLSTFSSFRKPKSLIYPLELPAPEGDREYKELQVDNLFDRYGYETPNYFYIAGSTLVIKSAFSVDYLDFWYYKWPTINFTTGTHSSWIVDQYPDAVVEEAAGAVFKMIGKDDEYNRYEQLFAQNISILRATDVGENN